MLNIYYGRENLDKEKFIFDNINLKEKTLILVPDQFTLDFERELFMHFNAKAIMDVEVLSMPRLGQRLVDELGGASRTYIDKYGRHMLLSRVIREEKDNLNVFRGMEGKNSFVELLNDFISELKQYNVSPEDLRESVASEKLGEVMEAKLEDLALIYSKYSEKIKDKYTDSEDLIDLYVKKISSSSKIKATKIWIYGFDSFAPKALSIIGELIGCAKEVNVVLTSSGNAVDRDIDLFALSKMVMKNIEDEAEKRRVEFKKVAIPSDYEIEDKCQGARIIEKNLYAFPAEKCEDEKVDSIKLVKARNVYAEAENAANFVLYLLREKGYSLSDIKIISNDEDKRTPIIKRIFSEYGINIFTDENQDISHNVFVKTALSILDALDSNYRTDNVLRLLKLGYMGLEPKEIDKLENYVRKFRIEGSMWLDNFTKVGYNEKEKEYKKEKDIIDIDEINDYRARAVKPLLDLSGKIEALGENIKCDKFVDMFIDFLENDLGLIDRINGLKDDEISKKAFSEFEKILLQIKEIIGSEDFDLRETKKLIEVGTRQAKIALLPPTSDDLAIGNIERTRIGKVRALVVLGANEKVLPMEASMTGIFQGDERDEFEKKGINILKTDLVKLEEERMAIYRNLVKPKDILYMSYSSSDPDGEASNPSSIFLKIKEIFPKVNVESDIVTRGSAIDLMGPNVSGLRHLAEALHNISEENGISPEWESALNWYKKSEEESLSAIEKGLGFDTLDEKLSSDLVDALYKKEADEVLTLSPSRLEEFSQCPFKHFIDYGLNPMVEDEFKIDPRDFGNICHNAFEHLAKEVMPADGKIIEMSKEEIEKFTDANIKKQSETYKDGILKYTAEDEYLTERAKRSLRKAAYAIAKQIEEGKIEKGAFEVKFGNGGELKPIELYIDGETVKIEGRIDRIDYLPNNRVKIIDYKTGDNSILPYQAASGYKLQLMLYLKAAKEIDGSSDNKKSKYRPAGVFYFNAKEEINTIDDASKLEETVKRNELANYKLNGILINDEEVIKSIAGEFDGDSQIISIMHKKDGTFAERGSTKKLLTDAEFAKLEELFDNKVEETVRRLKNGDISIKPLRDDKKTPCKYCNFKGICRFDLKYPECKFNDINKDIDLSTDSDNEA